MKILCQSCAAKYTIADDKVVGKVIKIKCKKCSATIVVNGNDPATFAQGALEPAADEQATKLFTQQNGADDGAMAANEWTVSVADDDQRTLTTDQIVEGYRAGQIPGDAFVWRDGMTDWLPLVNVPELMAMMGGAAAAAPAPAYAAPAPAGFESTAALPAAAYGAPAYADPNGGYGSAGMGVHMTSPQPAPIHATMPEPMAAAPAPAPAAAPAARRAGGRGGDLFGGGGGGMAAATQAASHVGERNETSVLFSLGALRAAEEQAAKGDVGGGRPKPPVKGKQVSEARVDDIFSLDAPAGPSLAPPPMMAPFIEPPPPPPPPQPVVAATQMGPMSGPGSYPMGAAAFAPEQPKKKSTGIIIGALAVVALGLVVVLVVVLTGKKNDPATASNSATTTSEKPASETTKPSDTSSPGDTKPSEPAKTSDATDTPPSDDSSSPSTPDSSSPDDPNKVASTNPSANKLFGDKKDPDKKDPDKKDPPGTDPPKDDPKDPPKDDGKAGTAEFDRGAASAALSSRAGAAAGCKKEGGPTGSAKVSVTFAPSGGVTQATVGAPFAGTPTGSCIAGAFQGARVPPFSGGAMTVTKTVSIR